MERTGTPEPESVSLTARPHKSRGGNRIRLPKKAYQILNGVSLLQLPTSPFAVSPR